MNQKKILIFLPGGVGGAERVGVLIGRILSRNSYNVRFVVCPKDKIEITDFIPSELVYDVLSDQSLRDFCILKMAKYIKQNKPDVVFAPCRYLSRNLIIASKLSMTGCKVIARSDNPLKTLGIKRQWLIRKTFPMADLVIAQHEEMYDEIVNDYPVSSDKVVTLHNPIDEETIIAKVQAPSPYSNSNEEIKFLWVAGIRESGTKGQDVLIKAFAKVKKKLPKAVLYMIGRYKKNGKFYQLLNSLIESYDIEESVHIMGYDDNPYKWVKHCDCFVLPSRVEGLPNSLIEAMYLGKPVVATRCQPIIDRMIEDGYNGYKVEVEDDDALATAMQKALGLKDFKMIYEPASDEQIVNIFHF